MVVLFVMFREDDNICPISSIKTRLKRFGSIKEKMQRKGIPQTMQAIERELNDIAGVRVICSFPQDVYMLAEALLKQDDIRLIQKKDYIKSPKPNGYRSLHLIVAVPVFLAMDFWASLEHQMHYKKDVPFTEEMEQELLACAEMSAALDERMDALRKKASETT